MPPARFPRQEEIHDPVATAQIRLKDPARGHAPREREIGIAALHVAEAGWNLDEHAAIIARQITF